MDEYFHAITKRKEHWPIHTIDPQKLSTSWLHGPSLELRCDNIMPTTGHSPEASHPVMTRSKHKILASKVRLIVDELDEAMFSKLERDCATNPTAPLGPAACAQDICSICFDDFQEVTYSICGRHIFCQHCLTTWLQDHPTCPTCRCDAVQLFQRIKATCSAEIITTRERICEVIATVETALQVGRDPNHVTAERIDKMFEDWEEYYEDGYEYCLRHLASRPLGRRWASDAMRYMIDENRVDRLK